MNKWMKALLGIVVVGALAGAAVTGRALAQSGSQDQAAAPKQEEFLSRLATKLGVSVDDLKGAISSTELDMLDQAVQQGTITPQRADRLRQAIENGRLLPPLPRARGALQRLTPGQRLVLKASAEALNTTPRALVQEMRTTGKSLAQLAEERGISRDELKSAIIDNVQKYVDQGLDKLRQNIDAIIDRTIGPAQGS